MTNARILMLSAIAAIALSGQPVLAHDFDDFDHGGNCRHEHAAMAGHYLGPEISARLAHRLGLSPEQRQALEAIGDKHRPELRQLRDTLGDNGRALRKAQADDPKLAELAGAQGKAIADMIVLHKQIRAEVDKVLTDQQREKLDMMRQHAWRHQREGRGGWHDRRG